MAKPKGSTKTNRRLASEICSGHLPIANAIIEDLFTNGAGEQAVNLRMMDEHDQNLGGWSREAARGRIYAILKKHTVILKP